MIVRPAVPGDAEQVRRVIERAILGSAAGHYDTAALTAWASGRSDDDVQRMIRTTDGFVATFDAVIVGWANLVGAVVVQLYVDPSAGDHGAARLLYEAVEHLAAQRGLSQLSTVASLRAEPVFERFGSECVFRTERCFNGHPFPVVHMRRVLGTPMSS